MGIIDTLKDAVTRQFYEGSGAHFIARGMSYPTDVFGKGAIRYGAKVEFTLPLLVPENRFRLDEEAIFQLDRIVLDREPTWVDVGGYIYIGERELHVVDDVVDNVLILGTRLLADHPENQPVIHYSNPVKVEGSYSTGVTTLVVDSTTFIVRGDHIAISARSEPVLAFKEYRVNDYRLVSITNGIYQYQVTLDRGIHRELDNEEIIQLRAFMAYQSKVLPLPVNDSFMRQINGPFLLDWVSAPFVRGLDISETQTVQRYSLSRAEIGPPQEVEKNSLLLDLPIRANQFLYWERVMGEVNYDGTLERFLMYLNDEGKFWLKHTCAPPWAVPFTYPRGSIVCAEQSQILNNDWFRIDDSENAVVFEYQIDGTYVPTPSAASTGWILPTAAPGVVNNDWFSLDDGFGTKTYFEYIADSATFTPTVGYVTIDVTSAVFPVDLAVPTEAAINGVGPLKITASRVGAQINLVNDVVSLRGNEPIEVNGNLQTIGWTASNQAGVAPTATFAMAGGTDAIETIDVEDVTTDVEVAVLTAAAVNRALLMVRADYPGIFNSFALTSEVKGISGNIPITFSTVSPQFIFQGMSGGSGGMRWNFEVLAPEEVTMRLRFYPNDWQPDTVIPAGTVTTVTAQLNPTDEEVERVDLLFKGVTADSEIQMGDWNISTPLIGALSYEYVMQMTGDYTYGSSGMWVKPLFPRLHDIQIECGIRDTLDTGLIRV